MGTPSNNTSTMQISYVMMPVQLLELMMLINVFSLVMRGMVCPSMDSAKIVMVWSSHLATKCCLPAAPLQLQLSLQRTSVTMSMMRMHLMLEVAILTKQVGQSTQPLACTLTFCRKTTHGPQSITLGTVDLLLYVVLLRIDMSTFYRDAHAHENKL